LVNNVIDLNLKFQVPITKYNLDFESIDFDLNIRNNIVPFIIGRVQVGKVANLLAKRLNIIGSYL